METEKATARVSFHGLAHGGAAVGKLADGRVIFVPFAAPGDVADVEITAMHKRYAEGRIVTLVEPSKDRITPECSYFGRCGGCQWQHLPLVVQQQAKQANLARAVGVTNVSLLSPGPAYGYRWRARLSAEDNRLGYRAWRSHEVVDVEHCPLLEPSLDEALVGLRRTGQYGDEHEIALQRGRGGVAHVISRGREGAAGDEAEPPQNLPALVDLASKGAPSFFIRPGLFAQPSEAGNTLLRKLVIEHAGKYRAGHILELFAGAGNFTRDLAGASELVTDGVRPKRLVAVESHPGSAALLGKNVPDFVEVVAANADTEVKKRFKQIAAGAMPRFDLMVLDPPRTGAKIVCASLGPLPPELWPRRVIYISCDPATLGRDLGILCLSRYKVESLIAVDLMPQTFHIEAVAVLVRR